MSGCFSRTYLRFKIEYDSAEMARLMNRDPALEPYECNECGKFHLTHKKYPKKKIKKRHLYKGA